MQKQTPLGPKNETCSRLGGRPCSEVCYDHVNDRKCTLWNEFRGRDATGEEFNGWFCGEAMQLRMLMEVAKEVRQGAAATESFRNEMCERADTNATIMNLLALAAPSAPHMSMSVNAQPNAAPVRIAATPGQPSHT